MRNLLVGYGDSIRLSDIKANIAVLFVAIMMGTVLQFRDNYPWYLNVPVMLAPFIVIFFNLLPRSIRAFPARDEDDSRSGAVRSRMISSSSPIRCWKLRTCRLDARSCPHSVLEDLTLQIAYLVAMATLVARGCCCS